MKKYISFLCYWIFSLVPKNKNLWAFSGFGKRAYMDNSKYLFEWILENHPEINAKWFTVDNEVYRQLSSEGKPVVYMKSLQGIKYMSQAAIAVTDHFVMSDYDMRYGFNNRTKVVQLWHGVGLKSMVNIINNSTFDGVVFSDDIILKSKDGFYEKIIKTIKYIRYAHSRELFEKYFMLICPGNERVLQIADKFGISRKNIFMTGHPRNIYLHKEKGTKIKILYAPTFRWDAINEDKMVNNLINFLDDINSTIKSFSGEFVIRLHPHTWRNYSQKIENALNNYESIRLDMEKDIYKVLGTYSIIISDYSSIAYDFVLLDRPVIFYCPDLEDYLKRETSLNYDYQEYSPGPKVRTWKEAMDCVRQYVSNPQKDSQWRCKVRDEFYDMSVNDVYNSERIVNEIKKRLM